MIEKQYIDIFNSHRKIIDSNSAPCLNALRDNALAAFEKQGFPEKNHEDYKYIDVTAEFVPDYALNLNRVPMKGNPYFAFGCQTPNLSTNLYYNLNDLAHKEFLPSMEYSKGVFVGSLKDFAIQHEAICKKYYGQIAKVDESAIIACLRKTDLLSMCLKIR